MTDQNRFKSHQPIRPNQSASLPKATTAKTMTPNGIGGSLVASTAIPAVATISISVAAMSLIVGRAGVGSTGGQLRVATPHNIASQQRGIAMQNNSAVPVNEKAPPKRGKVRGRSSSDRKV
jgi:hypothetical protein